MSQVTVDQAFGLAVGHHQAGRLAEAEGIYRQILNVFPQHAGALHYLGVMAGQRGNFEASAQFIRQAVAVRPDLADAWSNLGNALTQLGKWDEAAVACRRAIAMAPNFADAYANLGNVLRLKGELEEAVVACRRAVALDPNLPQGQNNLGNALSDRGNYAEAVGAYRSALALDPNLSQAANNLAIALREMGKWDEAARVCRDAIARNPSLPELHDTLGSILKDSGSVREAIASYREAIGLNPRLAAVHSNLVYTTHFNPAYDGNAIARELQAWDRQHAQPLQSLIRAHLNDRNPDRRLRIGYISADFRDHVVGRNLVPLFQQHDRGQFEITCYSNVLRPDARTAQFRQQADRWRNIVGTPDDKVAEQIRADQIDILVDLSMHMSGNRLLVLARKPAPVQATFAAYPGSTGMSAVDWRISDPYLEAEAKAEWSSEKTLLLPDSFWCYDPLDCGVIEVVPLPALERGAVTFGCLNNFCKINPAVLELWAQVLQQTPGSRLVLLAREGSHRERTQDQLARLGIDRRRVEFVPQMVRREYLQQYCRIDIGLDTFPYNGHTTSLDSFWMGVPVVTLVGKTPVARAGWSQLSNLGSTELAALKPEEFVRIAVELARDMPRLMELRGTLRKRMEGSALMDALRFARNIEITYKQMWRAWCDFGVVT